MHAFIQVLGNGSADSSASLVLFFPEERYLFECGDGTQRLSTEHTVKFSRLKQILLTSLSAPSIGGLFGFILTQVDAGIKQIELVAPKGFSNLFASTRSFLHRPSACINSIQVDTETSPQKLPITVTKSSHVTIQAVPIRYCRNIQIDTSFGSHYDAITYICRLCDTRGKFDPEKAMKLGVKKGRNFGILQKGNSVTTDDGTVVTPDQVMSPSLPGAVILVVACPTVDHIESVINSHALSLRSLDILDGKEEGSITQKRKCIVFHLGPLEVLKNHLYQKWCDTYGSSTVHIPLHPSVAPPGITYCSQSTDLATLHYSVDRDIFPIPDQAFHPLSPNSTFEARQQQYEKSQTKGSPETQLDLIPVTPQLEEHNEFSQYKGKWYVGDCRLRYTLAPCSRQGLDTEEVHPRYIVRNIGQPRREWRNSTRILSDEPEPAGNGMRTPSSIKGLSPHNVAVRFLGTGAAIPNKRRNVSAILLDMYSRGSILLDCGEGTWGQLVRHFGNERAQQVLCEMKIIVISHMHADHHLGLLRLLHERAAAKKAHPTLANGPQLMLVGPTLLEQWLEACQAATQIPLQDSMPAVNRPFRFFSAHSMADPQAPESKIFADTFGVDVGCVLVDHCPDAYGVILTDRIHNWKVVYSGDTRPCAALAEAGKDATLAIHEATLADGLEEEAFEKAHTTTSQALDVCAGQMNAWRTILTHFSQRYPRVMKLDEDLVKKMQLSRAACAIDHMCVDFTQLEELPKIVTALYQTFEDELSAIENVKSSN